MLESGHRIVIIGAAMIATMTPAMMARCNGLLAMCRSRANRVPSGTKSMPHFGHFPECSCCTPECMGQKYMRLRFDGLKAHHDRIWSGATALYAIHKAPWGGSGEQTSGMGLLVGRSECLGTCRLRWPAFLITRTAQSRRTNINLFLAESLRCGVQCLSHIPMLRVCRTKLGCEMNTVRRCAVPRLASALLSLCT